MTYPETITARVDERAISTTSRFFNASLSDILTELLQNARRADTTKVRIEEHMDHILFIDNGTGISDPQALLDFGRSDWSDDLQTREDSAGMGVFSLALRGGTISSRTKDGVGWQVKLTPDVFSGTQPAELTEHDGPIGTCIRFPRIKADRFAGTVVPSLIQYMPISVTLRMIDGRTIHHSGSDFLADCLHVVDLPYGRMGVTTAHQYMSINLLGHTIKAALPIVATIFGPRYTVRLDLEDTRMLRLVLPARKEVVEDDRFQQIRADAWTAIYNYILTLPTHALSTEHVLAARDLGIEMPWCKPVLREWTATTHRDYADPGDHIAVGPNARIIPPLDVPDAQFIAFSKCPGTGFFEENAALVGTPWYDAIPSLTSVECRLEMADAIITLPSLGDASDSFIGPTKKWGRYAAFVQQLEGFQAPEQIKAVLTFDDGEQRAYCTRAAIINPDHGAVAEAVILLGKSEGSVPLQPHDLSEYFYNVMFCPSDDYAADSWDTQEHYFNEEMMTYLRDRLLPADEARKVEICERVAKARYLLKDDETMTITMTYKGITDIIIQAASRTTSLP